MKSGSALKISLLMIAFVIIFHFCILLKIIPYDITWGGRLKNDSEMYVFEMISITINLILGLTLLIKGNYIRQLIPSRSVNIILWIFFILFGLNTIGNLFAETTIEKSLSLLTLALSILIWIVLKAKNNNATTEPIRR